MIWIHIFTTKWMYIKNQKYVFSSPRQIFQNPPRDYGENNTQWVIRICQLRKKLFSDIPNLNFPLKQKRTHTHTHTQHMDVHMYELTEFSCTQCVNLSPSAEHFIKYFLVIFNTVRCWIWPVARAESTFSVSHPPYKNVLSPEILTWSTTAWRWLENKASLWRMIDGCNVP